MIDQFWDEVDAQHNISQQIPSSAKATIYRRISNIVFNTFVVIPMLQKWYSKEVLQELAKREIKPEDFD